jgi:hypothetical protein
MKDWPGWWKWDLELTPHLMKRMEDRRFTDIDLRRMIEDATGYHRDVIPGRWVIDTRRRRRRWEIILEPDEDLEVLVVITAYPVGAD